MKILRFYNDRNLNILKKNVPYEIDIVSYTVHFPKHCYGHYTTHKNPKGSTSSFPMEHSYHYYPIITILFKIE